jgi:hypothetical protein
MYRRWKLGGCGLRHSVERQSMDQPFEGRPRILFLDDEPLRGEIFLSEHPAAIWAQTAGECLTFLTEPWDEVHLDHDLGGEVFVDHERNDCGMEVVRWLCAEPRPHLERTRFIVHTHNDSAALLMVLQLQQAGYDAEIRPFGVAVAGPAPPGRFRLVAERVIRWLLQGRGPQAAQTTVKRSG